MAKQYGFLIDASRCTGCRTCEVACKDKNNLPVGRNFRHVLSFEGGGWRRDRATGAWHTDTFAYYVSVSCNHCEDPACVKVCPTKAHFKRKEDGLVLIDRDKCIGCGKCALSCPVNGIDIVERKPHWNGACTHCMACICGCPASAIEYGHKSQGKPRYQCPEYK